MSSIEGEEGLGTRLKKLHRINKFYFVGRKLEMPYSLSFYPLERNGCLTVKRCLTRCASLILAD